MSSGGCHRRRCYYWYQHNGSKAPPHELINAQEGQESDEEEDVEGAPNSCDLVRALTGCWGAHGEGTARARREARPPDSTDSRPFTARLQRHRPCRPLAVADQGGVSRPLEWRGLMPAAIDPTQGSSIPQKNAQKTPLAQAWEGVVQGHTLREGGVGQPRLAPLSHHHHALSPPPRSKRMPLAQVWEGVVKAPAFQGFKVEKCESVEHAQQVGPWYDWKPIRNCP